MLSPTYATSIQIWMRSRNCTRTSRLSGNLVLVHRPIFHYELNVLQKFYLIQWIALYRDDVGKHAGTNGAEAIGPSHQFGGVGSTGLQRLRGRESELHHGPELASIQPVGIDTRVRAQSDTHSAVKSIGHVFLGSGNDDGGLLFNPGRKMHFRLMFFKPEEGEGGGHQERVVLFHQGDAFVVDEDSVLDGVDTAAYRVFN